MDFSSTERALKSIQRRNPPLSSKVIDIATQLLQSNHYNHPLNNSKNFINLTIELLQIGTNGDEDTSPIRWEPLAVGLYLTESYLQSVTSYYLSQNQTTEVESQVYMDGPRVPTIANNNTNDDNNNNNNKTSATNIIDEDQLLSFSNLIMIMCQTHLEHNEPRVRSLVAKVVGQHTKLGTTLLLLHHHAQSNKDDIMMDTNNLGQTITNRSIALYHKTNQSLQEHLASGRDTVNKSKSSEGALDDTTGWRALETNLFSIGSFIHAAGHLYFSLVGNNNNEEGLKDNMTMKKDVIVDETLLDDVEYCCIVHVNRHVRAAGIALLEQMVHACASSFRNESIKTNTDEDDSGNSAMKLLISSTGSLRKCIIKILKITLADNWSQVRMAASVLCRVFYETLFDYADHYPQMSQNTQEWLTSTYPILLPRMCLNRFYLAQGVKLYSHDTWRILFDRSEKFGCSDGIESVALNAAHICQYYVKMCDADNHAVREAGCQAIAELATKLGRSVKYANYLAPYVLMLLQALLMCFNDDSWPVRDEACLACGTFCIAYPEECKPELSLLFSKWTEQLTDQIWSVREDAAVALGDAVEAYGASMFDQVLAVVKESLPGAKNQPAMTQEEYKRRQNDIESHTNSQLYSCGSLAPKLRKSGAGRIGCGDCKVTRPKAPWEATDGCIYLIRELCIRFCTNGPGTMQEGIALTDEILIPIMTELADVCRVKHFPQSDDLRTTLWKQLPIMAKAIGKQRFKRNYLQLFMELMIKNMENRSNASSKLSVHAAGQCAEELSAFVGVGIFRGRLEEDWQTEIFDRVMYERKVSAANAGPGPEPFSPFGPLGGMVIRNNNEGKEFIDTAPTVVSPIQHNHIAGNSLIEEL